MDLSSALLNVVGAATRNRAMSGGGASLKSAAGSATSPRVKQSVKVKQSSLLSPENKSRDLSIYIATMQRGSSLLKRDGDFPDFCSLKLLNGVLCWKTSKTSRSLPIEQITSVDGEYEPADEEGEDNAYFVLKVYTAIADAPEEFIFASRPEFQTWYDGLQILLLSVAKEQENTMNDIAMPGSNVFASSCSKGAPAATKSYRIGSSMNETGAACDETKSGTPKVAIDWEAKAKFLEDALKTVATQKKQLQEEREIQDAKLEKLLSCIPSDCMDEETKTYLATPRILSPPREKPLQQSLFFDFTKTAARQNYRDALHKLNDLREDCQRIAEENI